MKGSRNWAGDHELTVVNDTSPLRALCFFNRLDLLPLLFNHVYVPPLVRDELRQPRPHLVQVDVRDINVVAVREPASGSLPASLTRGLHPPEIQAIALAMELDCEAVLMDEAQGRAAVWHVNMVPIGVLRILLKAKQRGHVGRIAPLIDRLRSEGRFFLSDELRARVLHEAQEDLHA